jgi:hypothetical protein
MAAICLGCGEAMGPGSRARGLTVCSVRCWWREYRARRRREMRQRCLACEETFVPTRRDARYCGDACRQHAFRERQAGRWRPREQAAPLRVREIREEVVPMARAPIQPDRAGRRVIDIASLIG